jgi:tetratricopeptide (TPR) repeat protein
VVPSLFVSYSHLDEPWKDRLIETLTARIDPTRVTVWNDRRIEPGAEWFVDIEAAMDRAAIAVCLVSHHYLQSRFCTEYEIGPLLARRERDGLVLVPVLIGPCAWNTVHWLKPIQMLPRDGKTLTDLAGQEDAILTEVAAQVARVLDDASYRPPTVVPVSAPDAVDLTRVRYTGAELVGRDAELARMNLAWRAFDTHVMCLVGWGGVGKTTLANAWLERLAADGYDGARRVFGWSLSGPSDQGLEGSADAFIHAALEWFGDPAPTRGSAWSKGERLAALVAAERTLLVVDGVEVVQSALAGERGRLRDPALATLLVELARRNPGLCVVTSRLPVADLQPHATTVAYENLERLSAPAGRALLRLGGVRGVDDRRLEAASRALRGDALALRLLASVLRDGATRAVEVLEGVLTGDAVPETEEADRVLKTVDAELGPGAPRELLTAVAVLDGAADPLAVRALLSAAVGEDGWQRAARELRRRALLSPEDDRWPDRLEAHPLVAHHFNERLRRSSPEAWTTAHRRLSEHYAASAGQSAALEAIYHSARAGDGEQAVTLFATRVDQRSRGTAGSFTTAGAALSALLPCFVAGSWAPGPALTPRAAAYLLNNVGALLRALGRLEDAAELFRHALAERKAQRLWTDAAKNASNLAEVTLVIGQIARAREAADEGVQLAVASEDVGQIIYCLTTLGDVLHQAGQFEDALKVLEQAEALHRQVLVPRGFPIPVLYRLPGIRYADCLLSLGRADDVLRRIQVLSAQGNDISEEESAFGIALIAEAMRQAPDSTILVRGPRHGAVGYADLALDLLRQSASELYLPKALLIRARGYAAVSDFDAASRDVERALVVARRTSAALFQIDARIEQVRLEIARGNRDMAAKLMTDLRPAIERLGYGRRLPDIGELETAI